MKEIDWDSLESKATEIETGRPNLLYSYKPKMDVPFAAFILNANESAKKLHQIEKKNRVQIYFQDKRK